MLQQMLVFQQVHCGAQSQTIPEISVQPAKTTLTSEVRSQVRALEVWQCYTRAVMQDLLDKQCYVQTVWFWGTYRKVQLSPEFRVSSLRGTKLCWHNPNKFPGHV